MCDDDLSETSNMGNWSSFAYVDDQGDDALGQTFGIALSGAYFFNSVKKNANGEHVDAVEEDADKMDVCLSRTDASGQFGYSYWSPCAERGFSLHDSTTVPMLCKDADGCVDDPSVTALTGAVGDQTPLLYTRCRPRATLASAQSEK